MKNLLIALMLAVFSFPAMAEMQHDHSSQSMQMARMEGMKHQLTTQCARIDDFDLCFDIMPHKDYQKMMEDMKMEPMKAEKGTTHHVAATIRREGVKVEDASATLKVVSPDGKEETSVLNYNPDMMYQYVEHFNMRKKGKYQVLITFEIGKEKHQGKVVYEVK